MSDGPIKAPFPYMGGKTTVADVVWRALGDCAHYIEPFCGSCAVLLGRPASHRRRAETVNDADGHLANVWRALQADPDAVAKWCDWPVNHADLIARKKVLNDRNGELLERICAADDYYDAKLAGYYVWAASCWIGNGMIRQNEIPHISKAGGGVHATGQIPHIGHAGKGVHATGQIPHVGKAGTGVQEPYETWIYEWFRRLSERLRRVRVVCGDWTRVCGGDWQTNMGTCGIFFDPPYSDVATRYPRCYAVDSLAVAHDVREWCRERGRNRNMRIVLAGYYEEHDSLIADGWTAHRWKAAGGYGRQGGGDIAGLTNRHRETLFMSPHCERERGLFDDADEPLTQGE